MPLEVQLEDGATADIAEAWLNYADGFVRARGPTARVVLEPPRHIESGLVRLEMVATNGRISVGRDSFLGRAVFEAIDGDIDIGAETTMRYAQLNAVGGSAISVGADCMFGFNVRLMTTDFHKMFDRDTGEEVNPCEDVVIGDHVWLADEVVVLKGARIGDGAIAGLRSLVGGRVAPHTVVAGSPARVLRGNVRWER